MSAASVLLCLGLFCSLTVSVHSAFFGWFIHRETAEMASPASFSEASEAAVPQPLFEMTTVDDKFVAEAQHLDLSPLDRCHRKVIEQLSTTCSDLSEEELAKLGVSLFNCQAEIEQRPTYPCTPEMALADCTAGMDPDTWNAYHIVSNRARSVCYATRQQAFKRRTEMTVNALVATASGQLEAMKMLKDGQEELRELTAASLENVVSSQHKLLDQQGHLEQGQQQLESSITGNLEELTREKELIASGHQQVAALIEGITLRMENVSRHLAYQDSELQQGHQAILNDLLEVRARAQQVYAKLESNLDLFTVHQSQMVVYYDRLMEKLQRMNQTVGMVMYMIDHLHLGVGQRLSKIQHFLDWTGSNLSVIYTCVVHVSYFLVAAIIMAFLQTPCFSRTVLLVLVLLNALSELNQCVSMDVTCLSLFLTMTVISNWILVNLFSCLTTACQLKSLPTCPSTPVIVNPNPCLSPKARLRTSTPERDSEIFSLEEELEKLTGTAGLGNTELIRSNTLIESSGPAWPTQHGAAHLSSGPDLPVTCMPVLKNKPLLANTMQCTTERNISGAENSLRHLSHVFESETNLSHSVTSNMSLTPRQLCRGITKIGQPCRNRAATGQDVCRIHTSGQSSYR
ncbi:protein brambleberry [Callorhinchus milii]|uniref:Protein brambleberry-like n=1 Tax=Callorhinchus milii TaxID=7868 RepID=A0A4W3GMS7_CALMI|nr:protein brambleberry [Callorhinchus milii]|eukprot:gi/632955007/ref/XP_007893259.1/ PREDICTED: protein brambleberry-like [Callorhinchus milii]